MTCAKIQILDSACLPYNSSSSSAWPGVWARGRDFVGSHGHGRRRGLRRARLVGLAARHDRSRHRRARRAAQEAEPGGGVRRARARGLRARGQAAADRRDRRDGGRRGGGRRRGEAAAEEGEGARGDHLDRGALRRVRDVAARRVLLPAARRAVHARRADPADGAGDAHLLERRVDRAHQLGAAREAQGERATGGGPLLCGGRKEGDAQIRARYHSRASRRTARTASATSSST